MARPFSLLFLTLVAVSTSCGPNPKPPVKVMAMVPDESGAFTTTQVELTTVGNMTSLSGDVIKLVGGTRVVLDPNDPTQQINGGIQNMPDDQRYDILVRDKGGDVRGHYVDKSGVLWPDDFHTWNMVTTYYNFERSYKYFANIYDGVDPKELRPMRVLYWSDVYLNSTTPLVDNALYLSFVKSFAVAPFKNEQLIPLPMNIGVVGHEVSHRVFNYNALSDQGIHPALGTWSLQAFNWLKSLDEGLADFHGYSVTCLEAAGCRPNFLALSLSDSRTVSFRNVGNAAACMDDALRTSFQNTVQNEWVSSPNLYKVGNLVAVSLFQAGNKTGKIEVLQKALITALDDESATTPGIRQLIEANKGDAALGQRNFTPEAVVDIIAAHITDPDLKKQVCTEFSTHMQLRCGQWPCTVDGIAAMPNCPSTARRENTCPLLTQP
ncbi:MAG: hypothetical protein QM817_17460 [Archangium sp.]